VIVHDAEAIVRSDGAGEADESARRERARLERELAEAEGWLAAARERLANDSFVTRAPREVVEGARAREAELSEQVARLRNRLGA
jgi:valyl-tRNA synthetase